MTKTKKQKKVKVTAKDQIRQLGLYILTEIPGEPALDETAVECAIHLLRNAYGPEAAPSETWSAMDRLDKFVKNHVPKEVLDVVGREGTPADTAINVIYKHYPHPVAS